MMKTPDPSGFALVGQGFRLGSILARTDGAKTPAPHTDLKVSDA
jgi:hypothetical protein